MAIPFTKAHGAGNDFLLTSADQVPDVDLPTAARAICDRHTGIGADGWILMRDHAIRLFNADGSDAEISGNGTRCVAALLVSVELEAGRAVEELTIRTGAGPKRLRLLSRDGHRFRFEMNMGSPLFDNREIRCNLSLTSGPQEVTILDVGNPQCVVFVESFPQNWESIGAEIEAHRRFPNRTNVAFARVIDAHTIETRFYERGAGVTLSSGTGSTGAAVAAILRKVAASPLTVRTAAGESLDLRWDESVYLTGPAEIIGSGEFYL